MKGRWKRTCLLLAAVAASAGAFAQIGLPVPVPQVPLPQAPPVGGVVDGALRTAESLTELRKLRIRELLRGNRDTIGTDPDGHPVLRRQVAALSPGAEALERARAAGFTVLSDRGLEGLDLRIVILQAPEGLSTRRALRHLRQLDSAGDYDYHHLYLESGAAEDAPAHPSSADAAPAAASPKRIGLIDSGVDGAHPALAGATIVRHGCDGAAMPAAHGTAVASLLVGADGAFRGVQPGATLYAADVFCGHGAGSLALLAVALDWMAREGIAVVNISLVGAKSVLLTGLVRAMSRRGHLLVAAVGNDGPAAPPLFPAAYPEVVGVTGVDARQRVLPEAGRGGHVDFAARGADLEAAQAGGGFGAVRGTSFATPIVAGLLAASLEAPDPARAQAALDALATSAVDLGRRGVDTTYGRGLVAAEFRPAGIK